MIAHAPLNTLRIFRLSSQVREESRGASEFGEVESWSVWLGLINLDRQ